MLTSTNSLQTLWRILHNVVRSSKLQQLTIIIDALDECDSNTVERFLDQFRPYLAGEYGKKSVSEFDTFDPRISWLITSRKEQAVTAYFQNALKIDLEDNAIHIQNAVQTFVDEKVDALVELKSYNKSLETFVRQTLKERADGVFLWVNLACRELSKPRLRAINVRSTLLKMPMGLNPLYDQILDQILCQNESEEDKIAIYVRQILHAMVVAFRPLKLVELAIAAGLPDDTWLSSSSIIDYAKACGSFVYVQAGTIDFVHLSVRTYISSVKKMFSGSESDNHCTIGSRCFQAIFDKDYVINDRGADMSFDHIAYQVRYWPDHVKLSEEMIKKEILNDHAFMVRDSHIRTMWFNALWDLNHDSFDEKPKNMSLLSISAYLDLVFVAEEILQHSSLVSTQDRDSFMNTPLIWATRMGNIRFVHLLLASGADPNEQNQTQQTAGHYAAACGYDDILHSLVNYNANLQSTDQHDWTPLHQAVNLAKESCVEILLRRGADLELKDYASWTPLQRASSNGHHGIVSILLENKACVEAKDRKGMSVLQTAACNGHQEVVVALLEAGASIQSRDDDGWTALHHACWAGQVKTTEVLLSRGSSVDSR